jgi:hypothetical protein
MDLARTFVSFSSTDKYLYDLMTAWKANENIDFNFANFQLEEAINSGSPYYIKSVCAAKIRRADTFVDPSLATAKVGHRQAAYAVGSASTHVPCQRAIISNLQPYLWDEEKATCTRRTHVAS